MHPCTPTCEVLRVGPKSFFSQTQRIFFRVNWPRRRESPNGCFWCNCHPLFLLSTSEQVEKSWIIPSDYVWHFATDCFRGQTVLWKNLTCHAVRKLPGWDSTFKNFFQVNNLGSSTHISLAIWTCTSWKETIFNGFEQMPTPIVPENQVSRAIGMWTLNLPHHFSFIRNKFKRQYFCWRDRDDCWDFSVENAHAREYTHVVDCRKRECIAQKF